MVKGQISAEFFLFTIFIVVVFFIFFVISDNMNKIIRVLVAIDRAKLVAFRVAHAANIAAFGSNNISINISVPSNYTLSIQPRSIVAMDMNNRSGSASILTGNVTMNISSGAIVINVRNINGSIAITG